MKSALAGYGDIFMCVIFVKPQNVAFPEDEIMQNCWDNNPHMAGFMYTWQNKVVIRKGFKDFEKFKSALNNARKITGDNIPYICHFRISTQGYGTECCQPFPLTEKMQNMKKERYSCSIGVAHNGILDLTSDGSKNYSDTMKFISDYLVNIIQGLDWYKNKRFVKLIENLIDGSRLAILDQNGHFETLGNGWVQDKGIWYSNTSYSRKKLTYDWKKWDKYTWDDDFWDDGYCWKPTYQAKTPTLAKEEVKPLTQRDVYDELYWNEKTKQYDFPSFNCPFVADDDDSYCLDCAQYGKCRWTSYMFDKASGFSELY